MTMTSSVVSVDPRTGRTVETVAAESEPEAAESACRDAVAAGPWWEDLGRLGRADALDAIAAELASEGDHIVALADRETALGEPRLTGELARTTGQFRFFADVLRDGGYLDATIDHADPGAATPRPDLRRMLVPLGPVAVFGASNFPLAFSVPGGDTASALAAGCPVVVKAHPAHPATSEATAGAIRRAMRRIGAPDGLLGLLHGRDAGAALVWHPHIRAVGFTGSVAGGRALFDLASARPDPIPFYGELGSLNPLVVTPGAAATRAVAIGRGVAESVLLGRGQFCTKPGLVLIPDGPDGGRIVDELVDTAKGVPAGPLLTAEMGASFRRLADQVADLAEVLLDRSRGTEAACGPVLVRVPAADLVGDDLAELREEHFGPFAVVAAYRGLDELRDIVDKLAPALVASVHATDDEHHLLAPLLRALRDKVGRIVWNGYPTGVAVSWAMHHGGPYPSTTNALHTSVGAAAIRRWLRPVTYQALPSALLPDELRDEYPSVPRRLNGELRTR
jgi:NADP-dependent aldehyde dehydrogenase